MQKLKDSLKTWVMPDSSHTDFTGQVNDSIAFTELIDQMTDQLAAAHCTQSSTLAAGHASAQRALEAGQDAVLALVAGRVEGMRQVALENTMLRAQLAAIGGRSGGKDASAGDAADAAAGSQQQGAFSSVLPFTVADDVHAPSAAPPKLDVLPGMVHEGKHGSLRQDFGSSSRSHSTMSSQNLLSTSIDGFTMRQQLDRPSSGSRKDVHKLALMRATGSTSSRSEEASATASEPSSKLRQSRPSRQSMQARQSEQIASTSASVEQFKNRQSEASMASESAAQKRKSSQKSRKSSHRSSELTTPEAEEESSCSSSTQDDEPAKPSDQDGEQQDEKRRTTRFDLPDDAASSCRGSQETDVSDMYPRSSAEDDQHKENHPKTRFEVARVWIKDSHVVGIERKSKRAVRNKALIKAATRALVGNHLIANIDSRSRWMAYFVVSPGSPLRGMWDILSLLLVLYDIFSIPLVLLNPPDNDVFKTMAWITRIFWSLDIPMSFCTGYLNADGSVELSPFRIIKAYVKSWFCLDIMLVSVDWAELFAQGAADAAAVGRASRTFRILRMIRLMRLVRMRDILRVIQARIRSEKLIILVDIIKIMAGIAAVAHFIACCWYGIGKSSNTESWISAKGVDDLSLFEGYLTSLHWSISQFHGGMDEVTPQGLRERIFAVCVFLFAWMVAAAFVSGLTSEMTRLHILASHQSRQLNVLNKFLRQSNVSDKLCLRVMRNAQHAISEQQRLMPELEVELLRHVSEPLRVELHFEMYGPVLEVHPFFEKYVFECPQVMRKVCHEAMSTLLIATGDVIFNAGEIAGKPKMYIVCSGLLEYIPYNGSVVQVHSEMWLSEGALWTKWMHRGVLKTVVEGRLCLLSASLFQDIVGCFDHTEFDPRRYAAVYVDHLNHLLEESSEMITDLPMGDEEQIASRVADVNFRASAIGRASEKLQKMMLRRRSAFMDPASSRRALEELARQTIVPQ